MPETYKHARGIIALGLGIIISNLLLIIFHYPFEAVNPGYVPDKLVSTISIVAVFPLDFYHSYLKDVPSAHLAWIMITMLSGVGILMLNRFARDFFIVLNIIHITILGFIVVLSFGQSVQIFLDYFFKLYFNLVAAGLYVSFLTFPEVLEQFRASGHGWKNKLGLLHPSAQKIPPDPKSYYNLGLAYSRMNRQEQAVSALEKASKLNPRDENVRYFLGMAHFRQKNYSAAITAFNDTVRLNPLHIQAYYHMGLIYQAQGCLKEAAVCLEQAGHVQPDNTEIAFKLGEMYALLGQREQALKLFERVVNKNPGHESAHFEMGKIFIQSPHKEKEAQEAFNKSLRFNPRRKETHFFLGQLAAKAGRHKDAVRHFKDVLRLDEDDLQAHYQLGFSYAMLQDFESSRREYRYLKERDQDLAGQLEMLIKQ